MELFIAIVAVASLAVNVVVAKRFFDWAQIKPVELEVVESECRCHCTTTVSPEPVVEPEPAPVVEDTEKYQAWRNRTEEPTTASTPSFGPAPKPGPMERPSGFYR